MTTNVIRRAVSALAVASTVALVGLPAAAAEPYTRKFTGEGHSSFGFAWEYARWNAHANAVADGFTDPFGQCGEIHAFGDQHYALVVWECTREV
jgi:hypothetical protein